MGNKTKEKDFLADQLKGLPNSACEVCGACLLHDTFTVPALCDKCKLDNQLIDMVVDDLRLQGR